MSQTINKNNIPKPISKRQHMYVTSIADVTLFGGAAGSGKSEIGVIDFLQYLHYQNFIGVITRRTTPQLKGPGGIFSKCKRIFNQVYKLGRDYVWKDKENKFVFYKTAPDGTREQVSELFLKHFEHEKDEDNWQGIEANLYLVDEGCQFTIGMIQYIMSRMRNPSCPEVEPKLKITCNPDADHEIRSWVAPYLNEDGTPDRSKDGLIRYFTYSEGEFCWGDSKEEVMLKAGVEAKDVLSFTFISANVYDNRIVQEINPKYVAWLKGLRGVERERLLHGNWNVRESTSTHFQRKWVREIISPSYDEYVKICRAWDFASSLPSDANPSPDYTTSVKMAKTRTGDYVILDVTRTRIRTGEWYYHVLEHALKDGGEVDIILPQDPNAAAKAGLIHVLLRPLNEAGFYAISRPTNQKKLERFRPFSAACQNGLVSVVSNCSTDYWNKTYNDNNFFYKELEAFTGERKKGEAGHDDLPDSCSDAFMYLAQQAVLPKNFIGSLQQFNTKSSSPLLSLR